MGIRFLGIKAYVFGSIDMQVHRDCGGYVGVSGRDGLPLLSYETIVSLRTLHHICVIFS